MCLLWYSAEAEGALLNTHKALLSLHSLLDCCACIFVEELAMPPSIGVLLSRWGISIGSACHTKYVSSAIGESVSQARR